jgi:DNA (cytosine-5)-methyltransferase 1
MSKPRLLDLFCGAGGAAMGYHRAGFEVVGVDIKPQPHYPFEFHRMAWDRPFDFGNIPYARDFAAIHASPPCQAHSVLAARWPLRIHPDLIPIVRHVLVRIARPYVIENVPGAPIRKDIVLQGTMFGLHLRRERWFEINWPFQPMIWTPANPAAFGRKRFASVTGNGAGIHGGAVARAEAMGIDWMTKAENAQAIPPAYTEWIGKQLLAALEKAA